MDDEYRLTWRAIWFGLRNQPLLTLCCLIIWAIQTALVWSFFALATEYVAYWCGWTQLESVSHTLALPASWIVWLWLWGMALLLGFLLLVALLMVPWFVYNTRMGYLDVRRIPEFPPGPPQPEQIKELGRG